MTEGECGVPVLTAWMEKDTRNEQSCAAKRLRDDARFASLKSRRNFHIPQPRRRRRVYTSGYITNGATICRTVTFLDML